MLCVASKCKQVGKCHDYAAPDESHTIAPWLAHLPGKQKVLGSNPGFFQLALQSEFSGL